MIVLEILPEAVEAEVVADGPEADEREDMLGVLCGERERVLCVSEKYQAPHDDDGDDDVGNHHHHHHNHNNKMPLAIL